MQFLFKYVFYLTLLCHMQHTNIEMLSFLWVVNTVLAVEDTSSCQALWCLMSKSTWSGIPGRWQTCSLLNEDAGARWSPLPLLTSAFSVVVLWCPLEARRAQLFSFRDLCFTEYPSGHTWCFLLVGTFLLSGREMIKNTNVVILGKAALILSHGCVNSFTKSAFLLFL